MKQFRNWLFWLVVVFCFVGSGYSALLWYQGTDLRNIKADPMASFEPEGVELYSVGESKGTRGSLFYLKPSSASFLRIYITSGADETREVEEELRNLARSYGWDENFRRSDPSMKLYISSGHSDPARLYVLIESP